MDGYRIVQLGNGDVEMQGTPPQPSAGYTRPPVLKAGQFSPNDRVGVVRWPSGKTATFAGDLLTMALSNGAKLVRELQAGKPGGSDAVYV